MAGPGAAAGNPRHYAKRTKQQKLAAVVAAEMTNVAAASAATGIPESSIKYWLDQPEFVAFRAKTQADTAEEAGVLVHLIAREIAKRIAEFEPHDLSILYGIAIDKAQLLSGGPTDRTEHVTIGMDDHEREQLRDVLRKAVADAG